ncbi:SDR family oxidoreductase, partial [Brevibacterium luteolum]|uniref:SDR family oxidoreductase n=1 Tax=Brevibacterium luteolum TaxID=199591 RepID=UPI00223C51D3
EIREYMGSFSVLGDVASPDDVAEAVAFLLSSRSRRITGTMLDTSGGSALGARPAGTSVSLRSFTEGEAAS